MHKTNRHIMNRFKAGIIILFTFILLACADDGDSGDKGVTGTTGPEGPAVISQTQTSLSATINSINIDNGPPIVNFTIVDQDGAAYTELSGFRFTLAKLVPGSNGDNSAWQSYINRTEETDGSIGIGTETAVQAHYERDGALVNHKNGIYTYTFENDITQISVPIAVVYEPTLTHRIGLQVSGSDQPVTNTTYTWRPSDGATTDIFSRNIVMTESCNECHGNLAIHGGGRVEVKYCVTCHNPGTIDANSTNTLDFATMIHKIHSGTQLPSVVAGGDYVIYGFNDSPHDYSDVTLPQDVRHCSKCHDALDVETPDARNWQTRPTMEACGSCHDDVDFAAGGHSGGIVTDNTQCAECHNDRDECTSCHTIERIADSVAESHAIDSELAALSFAYNIVSTNNTGPGEFPEITFSVTDPNDADATNDILNDAAWTASDGASRLAIDIAWSTADYTNTGSGNGAASSISLDPLTDSNLLDNNNGSYTITSGIAIPASATGSLAIGIEGHPAADLDGDETYSDRIAVISTVDYFSITDAEAKSRREIVTIEKCNNCHSQLSIHGANRTGSIELCVMCHNANNTDINQRPSDISTTSDSKAEESIDFKTMIHAIHAGSADEDGIRENGLVVYGFGGTEHSYSTVRFIGELENCETCHVNESYALPLADGVLGTTIDSGTDSTDPTDDTKITPIAAVCSSCHDSSVAQNHMSQNGASFSTSQALIDDGTVIETCVFCHGEDNINDIKTAHGIE